MSTAGWEVLSNAICFGVAFLIGGFMIFMYRQYQPRLYGRLVWAGFLILAAAFCYGLYTAMLESFTDMKPSDASMAAASARLAENLKLLAFVVPAVLLGVAVNLVTAFMETPLDGSRNQER